MRIGAIFVAICMVIIAGSAGALVYLFGFGVAEATVVALASLTALGVFNLLSRRGGPGANVNQQFADLSRAGADLARQVAEMGRRLTTLEGRVETALDKTRAATDPITVEIGELGALVKQLAETVAAQQSALDELSRRPAAPAFLPTAAFGRDVSLAPAAPVETAPASEEKPAAATPPPSSDAANETALAAIRSAIDGNRVDLYLQPIVTLPQRKVRYYEAMSRLRTDRGEILHAADFVARAEAAGLMPKIDNLVAFRCVQVVRRLLLKNRDIGLFCNLSGATLTDSAGFPQFLEFLDANRAIAPSLVLEFTQSAVRAMGPIEHESLAALAERSFRFSMDNVTDMRIEPRDLAARGFRFIKVPASFLLNRNAAQADIHPADLSDLVGRFGIDLIADKIESEGAVVDLLDYDVRYGQGFLFSPPRPVRAEALQGIAERNDVVAREAPVPAEQAASGNTARVPDGGKEERSGLAQLARGAVNRG
jgi:cyclic-di-GMP phosphodiesterase TipF (flagellum assembly factor)